MHKRNTMDDGTVVTSNKWDWGSREGSLDFPHVSTVWNFFPLLYRKAKQRTKKNSQEEEKLQASFPDLHRRRREGPVGGQRTAHQARSLGTGKTMESTTWGSTWKRGTYCNVKTLIRDNWKWGFVFEPVSGLLVDYVKVHCQKLWEKYMPRVKKTDIHKSPRCS